jgi:GAF domain-containing protein
VTFPFWILLGTLPALAVVGVVWILRARHAGMKNGRSEGPRPASAEPVERERRRQKAVDDLNILDTAPEDRFDRIVTMARQLYGTESAVFSIIDNDREWHKSRSGKTILEAARTSSFCSVTIRGRDSMIVGDASADPRFNETAAVVDDPGIRFYAGYPVKAPGGQQIGALCVYDPKPRDGATVDDSMLRQLAHLLEAELKVAPERR